MVDGGKERLMLETEPLAQSKWDGLPGSREMYLILYPKELEDEVIRTLESTGVPGYTEMPKMVGRGRRIRHFDNAVWPGATGALFTVLSRAEAQVNLVPSFRALAANLESRSHGLYGLHMFALPCEQLI
jgi:hypothetical protein